MRKVALRVLQLALLQLLLLLMMMREAGALIHPSLQLVKQHPSYSILQHQQRI
jgi:hypothetical protein